MNVLQSRNDKLKSYFEITFLIYGTVILQVLFYHLRGEQLSQWMTDFSSHQDRESTLFDVIMDFLKSTGVNQLITHVSAFLRTVAMD